MPMSKKVGLAQFTMAEAPAEEVEAVVRNMVDAVVEEEPGTLVYAWYRHVDEPNRWSVLEVYADEAAQQAHLKGPKVRAASKPLGTLIDMEHGGGFLMEAIAGKGVA